LSSGRHLFSWRISLLGFHEVVEPSSSTGAEPNKKVPRLIFFPMRARVPYSLLLCAVSVNFFPSLSLSRNFLLFPSKFSARSVPLSASQMVILSKILSFLSHTLIFLRADCFFDWGRRPPPIFSEFLNVPAFSCCSLFFLRSKSLVFSGETCKLILPCRRRIPPSSRFLPFLVHAAFGRPSPFCLLLLSGAPAFKRMNTRPFLGVIFEEWNSPFKSVLSPPPDMNMPFVPFSFFSQKLDAVFLSCGFNALFESIAGGA